MDSEELIRQRMELWTRHWVEAKRRAQVGIDLAVQRAILESRKLNRKSNNRGLTP